MIFICSDNGGVVCTVKMAEFQAGSLIAYRFINWETNLIVGNDTDYAALVGGRPFVTRNFKINRNRGDPQRSMIETMKVKTHWYWSIVKWFDEVHKKIIWKFKVSKGIAKK